MNVFWEKGFEATSVQDIVDRTGVNRSSLYASYRDKQGLFLAALDRYRDRVVTAMLCDLERPDSGLAEIRGYFERVLEGARGLPAHPGCLMTNSAVEATPRDRAASSRVREHMRRLERAFTAALERSRVRGELRSEVEVADLASFLTASAQGLAVLIRSGAPAQSLEGVVRVVLGAIAERSRR